MSDASLVNPVVVFGHGRTLVAVRLSENADVPVLLSSAWEGSRGGGME